jgi:Carboxypeptidase regulatory-like domain/TonB-dependent Receptor Plug Domain/TonB dependent receptor
MCASRGNASCLLLILAAARLVAQQTAGNIRGAVTDPSGAGIPSVTVNCVNELTGERHTASTTGGGDYVCAPLPVGQYRIEATAQGFKKYVRPGITVEVNQNARIDVRLELGAVSEEVVVKGGVPLVDTHEVQLGHVVDEKRIQDLPLNGRNPYSLVTLLPGVSSASLPPQPDLIEGTLFTINGARSHQTDFLLDGGMNLAPYRNGGLMSPSPDSVEEFRVITSNYNAEYGRAAGGVVTVATKSGTNQLHGSLYEFLRNDDLDARSFFQPSVSPLKRNQFGGTVGGPIRHDGLFYFFSYQGDRVSQGSFVNGARTPTAAQRQGNFSDLPAARWPKDPGTGQPFAGGIIPQNRLDPVAQNILKFIALPNTPDGRVEAFRSTSQNDDQYFGRSDYQINPTHRASASLFSVRAVDTFPFTNQSNLSNIPDYAPSTDTPRQTNVTLNETWTARSNLFNEFTFNYTHGLSALTPVNRTSWPELGSKYVPGSLPAWLPRFTVSGGWNAGNNSAGPQTNDVYSWADSVMWVRGAHSLKAGGLFRKLHVDAVSGFQLGGIMNVTGDFTGNAFADFVLGQANSMNVGNSNTNSIRQINWAAFVQDDWKISRKVTLNLGLRYEVFTPYVHTQDHLGTFRLGQQSTVFPNAPRGLAFPGDPGVPRGLIPTDYNNFAPRFGIAVDPFGDGRTAIRAGYGVFYSVGYANFTQLNGNNQPFLTKITLFGTPSFVDPFANAGGNPFPIPAGQSRFILPIIVAWLDENQRTPYVQQYSFTVQRQVVRNVSAEAAYVGNVSRKLQLNRDINQPIFVPGRSTAANVNDRRPIMPGVYGLISQSETAANASYNSLQTSLRSTFAHGFTLLANYTYSKAIDIQSADSQDTADLVFVDFNNLRLDRGPAGHDRRHVFNLSFLWQAPAVRQWGFLGKRILSGWQVNAIARYSSGGAFSVNSGGDTNLNGVVNDRPNVIGNPFLDTGRTRDQKLARYFNPAAFAVAASGTNGTAGRNIMYGPGSGNWDVSFFKDIPLHERHQIQFRAEFFNFFNHPNFGNPVSVLVNANVARILGAAPGRIIQFALRYSF